MSTKTINTRIRLKYDEWRNWFKKGTWSNGAFTPDENAQTTYADGFIPLAGEVVFFSIPGQTGAVAQEPAVLFKVGDGVISNGTVTGTTLANLPWGSAIAADVYAWAKNQSLLGGTNNGGTWTWSSDSAYTAEQEEVSAFIKKETANIKVKVDKVTADNYEDIYHEQYTDTPEQQAKIGKYQTSVSTTEDAQHNPIWEATGDPFAMEVTNYTASNGVQLSNNDFSIKLKNGETNLDIDTTPSTGGLTLNTATVTYTPAQAAVPATVWGAEDYAEWHAIEGNESYDETYFNTNIVGNTKTAGTSAVPANLTGTSGVVQGSDIATVKSYVDAVAAASSTASVVTVEEQTTAETGYAKTYVVKQNGSQVGAKINIPKDFLVRSASIETVDTADVPYTGAVVGDKYIDFIINAKDGSATAEHIYLPVNDLVDAYTANNQTGYVTLAIDEHNNITATAHTQSVGTAHAAQAATYYTAEEAAAYNTEHSLSPGDQDYKEEGSVKTPAVEEADGLTTAVDVKTYVDNAVAGAVPNIAEGNGIGITTSGNTKTVAVKLDETGQDGNGNEGSGLALSSNGLKIDDSLTWVLTCGGAD